MLDYVLRSIHDAGRSVRVRIRRCVWAVFTRIVNFLIHAILDFLTLTWVWAALNRTLNFTLYLIARLCMLSCVQDMCEKILDIIRSIILVVLSFNNREMFNCVLLDRWQLSRQKLHERGYDCFVNRSEAESRWRELVDAGTRFYNSEVIRVRDLYLYAQLLYRATRAALQFFQAHRNCKVAQSRFNVMSRLVRRGFQEHA